MRQRGDDVFDDAVSEILLLRVIAHIVERQHGNRGFVGIGARFQRGSWSFPVCLRGGQGLVGLECYRERPDRLLEALQLLFAEAVEGKGHAPGHCLRDRTLHHHAAGIGQLLEPLCKHDAGAGNRIIGDYHLAEGNADAQLGFDVVIEPGVVRCVGLLECQRSCHGVGCAFVFGDQCIAAQFPGVAAVGGNGFRKALECRLHALVRDGFVLLHQRGRSDHIGVHDNRELA